MHYKDFGYNNYDEYLAGKEWKSLKDFFYKNCGPYRCRICGKHQGLLLHKRTYEYLSLKILKRRYIYFKPMVVRWLRKYFVYLCHPCNGEVHFYDDGTRVPLTYAFLWKREQEIYKRHRSLWIKFLKLKPSDLFRAIGKLLTAYSV